MNTDIYIVNFNTTQITNNAISSIREYMDNDIYILDNSYTSEKFHTDAENVTVLDNTSQQLIDFDNELENISAKTNYRNNFYRHLRNEKDKHWYLGSFFHTMSIQYILDNTTNNVLLFDSDIILKKNCTDMIDETCLFTAQIDDEYRDIKRNVIKRRKRAIPFICYLNSLIIRNNNIRYYNRDRMIRISSNNYNYDTGYELYKYAVDNNIKFKKIRYTDYITHFKGSSWKR